MARSYATSSIVEAGLDDVTDKYRGTGSISSFSMNSLPLRNIAVL